MSDKYTLTEVRAEIHPGVTVIASVSTLDGLASLLEDLKAHGMGPDDRKKKHTDKDGAGTQAKDASDAACDSPSARIEVNAGIEKGSLEKCNVLAFKDGVPQLLRPGAFTSVTEGALVLIHAIEMGLRSQGMDYEAFKGLYEAQSLKSGTPLSMLMTNLRNRGYLDKNAYRDGRKIRLTAKGDKRAVEIMKEMIAGG